MTKATTNSKLTFNEVDFFSDFHLFVCVVHRLLLLQSMGSRLLGFSKCGAQAQ